MQQPTHFPISSLPVLWFPFRACCKNSLPYCRQWESCQESESLYPEVQRWAADCFSLRPCASFLAAGSRWEENSPSLPAMEFSVQIAFRAPEMHETKLLMFTSFLTKPTPTSASRIFTLSKRGSVTLEPKSICWLQKWPREPVVGLKYLRSYPGEGLTAFVPTKAI